MSFVLNKEINVFCYTVFLLVHHVHFIKFCCFTWDFFISFAFLYFPSLFLLFLICAAACFILSIDILRILRTKLIIRTQCTGYNREHSSNAQQNVRCLISHKASNVVITFWLTLYTRGTSCSQRYRGFYNNPAVDHHIRRKMTVSQILSRCRN